MSQNSTDPPLLGAEAASLRRAARRRFRIARGCVPEPGPGEVVTRTIWLSIDPYMRGRLREQQTYAVAIQIGEVMTGETVGEVIASADSRFAPGDVVVGARGWQTHCLDAW